jgi:hypothetical protein
MIFAAGKMLKRSTWSGPVTRRDVTSASIGIMAPLSARTKTCFRSSGRCRKLPSDARLTR